MPGYIKRYWQNAGLLYLGYFGLIFFIILGVNLHIFPELISDIKFFIILIGFVATLNVIHRVGQYFSDSERENEFFHKHGRWRTVREDYDRNDE